MAATAMQVAQLRRMVAEPTDATYDDMALADYIEAHPMRDELGNDPYVWDYSTTPATKTTNPDWVATYDLHAAAADVWDEKAAALAANMDFTADGATHHLSQQYQQAAAQAQYYRGKAAPVVAILERTDAY